MSDFPCFQIAQPLSLEHLNEPLEVIDYDSVFDDDFYSQLAQIEPVPEKPIQCNPASMGPLLVEKLPSDAWDKWCKDGVVCFAMGGNDILKVYFADPRGASVYHVTDFDFVKFHVPRFDNKVGCTLSGSKLYMIGGRPRYRDGFTDVYFCDVATQPQLPDGGYEWKPGPALNSYKPQPFVFSLAGNIYVLSTGVEGRKSSSPFEVLKSNSSSWEVLPPPPSALWSQKYCIVRSSIIDGKKIVVRGMDYIFYIYDAADNQWTTMQYTHGHLLNWTGDYCLHVQDNGFLVTGPGHPFVINFGSQSFETFPVDAPNSEEYSKAHDLDKDFQTCQWNLFHLKDKKFFFVVLCADYINYKSYARLGTFDMVDDFGSDVSKHSKMAGYGNESDAKRFKMAGYSVTNLKFKCIDLADGVQGRFLYAELLSLTGTARLSLLVKLNELQLCSCFLAGGYTCEVGRSFGVVFLERDWVYLQYLFFGFGSLVTLFMMSWCLLFGLSAGAW
ncbi:hypothetical protein SCA6_009994 [Theobroma cacao]